MPDGTPAPTSAGLLWSPSATYAALNVVEYQGHLYQARAANTGSVPSATSPMWTPYDAETYGPGVYGTLAQVAPVLNCIYPLSNPKGLVPAPFSAVFGYANSGSSTVVAPIMTVGPEMNAVNGGAMGQATTFLPGVHNGAFFATSPSGANLTWTLGAQSATAVGSNAPTCAVTSTPDGPVATVGGTSIPLDPDPIAILSKSKVKSDGPMTLGASPGAFRVGADGSATYSMPLWTPPARMEMGPSLSLSYSSRAGRGLLGHGWNVSGFGLSRISRRQKTFAQDGDAAPIDFTNDDAFCLDGARLWPTGDAPVNGKTVYQAERDPFTRVLFDTQAQSWEVDVADGRVLTYGTSKDSRHRNARIIWEMGAGSTGENNNGGPTNVGNEAFDDVLAWALDSATDPFGNQMTVTYELFTDTAEALASGACTELRPKSIAYTAGPTGPASRGVGFAYDPNPPVEPSCKYISGFGVGAQSRITGITMIGPGASGPQILRTYAMTYVQSPATKRSLLQSVQECAGQDCKAPTTFSYSTETPHFRLVPGAMGSLASPQNSFYEAAPRQFVDLNDDGKDDIVFGAYLPGLDARLNNGLPVPAVPVEGYALSDGTGFGTPHVTLRDEGRSYVETMPFLGSPFAIGPYPNGTNGAMTFVQGVDPKTSCQHVSKTSNYRKCFTQADGTLGFNSVDTTSDVTLTQRTPSTLWAMAPPYFLGDLNGDGLSDLLGTSLADGGGIGWSYWLNSAQLRTPAGAGIRSTGQISSPNGSSYAYVVHVDTTGKAAFLVRTGGATDASSNPTFTAITADGPTGEFVTQPTTLPTGDEFVTLQAPPNCTPSSSNPCLPTLTTTPQAYRYIFIDLNGDGNDDALQVPTLGGAPSGVRLNTGTGFGPLRPLSVLSPDPQYALPAIASSDGIALPQAGTTKVADINGDGLPDLLIANNAYAPLTNGGGPIVAYLSNGANGFTSAPLADEYGLAIYQGGTNTQAINSGFNLFGNSWGADVLDFDGDGRMDIYTEGMVYVQEGTPDQLTAAQDGLGKATVIHYATIGRDSALKGPAAFGELYSTTNDCQYPIQCLVKGMTVVSDYEASNDLGTAASASAPRVDLQYLGGRTDMRGRGWLGFSGMSTYDSTTQTTTTTTYSPPGTDTGYGYPLAGMPIMSTVTAYSKPGGQGNARTQETLTNYDVIATLAGRGAVVRAHQTETAVVESNQATGFSTPITSTSTQFDYDTISTAPFHLIHRLTTWNESGETDDWRGAYTSNTTNGKWLLSLPQYETETSTVPGQPAVKRTRNYQADPNTGLTQIEWMQEPSGSNDLVSALSYTRNASGQLIQVTLDASDPIRSVPTIRHSYVTYDSFDGVFPVSTTNDLGQTTRTVYDPGLGFLAFAEDPNGVKVHATCDEFGRRLSVAPDGGGATTFKYEVGQPYKEATASNYTEVTVETVAAGGGHSVVTYNMLGHEVVRGSLNHDGAFSYVETTYDPTAPGRVKTVSLPHAYAAAPAFHTYSYDEMGRRTGVLLPDGNSTATSYLGRATSTTDPNGNVQTRVADDRGRLVRLDEDSTPRATYPQTAVYQRPATAVSTNYAYGPFNVMNQISVTARASQGGATTVLSTMGYDSLGRRTSLIDADSGATSTTYDAFGEMTSETDANGDVHIPTRDALGRIVADYSSRDGITTFQWDTAANGVGKLASATSPDGVTTQYAYDAFSRPVSTTWSIPSQGSYSLSTPYNAQGQVSGIGYPGNEVNITFGFDAAGGVSSVSTPAGELGWQANTWEADGRIRTESYGSTLVSSGATMPDRGTTTRTYDATRGWLTGIQTTGTGGVVQDLSYGHDADGNLNARTDGGAGTVETFHNDFLNRLDRWTFGMSATSPSTTTTFGYTDLGNLAQRQATSSTGLSTTTVYASGTRDAIGTAGEAGVHALMAAGPDSYGYDAKGNQTTGPTRTVAYSSFDLPKSVTTSAGTTTFLYDASHQRVLKTGPAGTTVSIGGLYERRTDAHGAISDVFYVPGGSGRIVAQEQVSEAKPTLPRVYYFHDDHLGSIESVTGYYDSSGFYKGVGVVVVPSELGAQHFKYDPFGQRIDAATGAAVTTAPGDITTGFTEQGQDDDLGLIDMKGRVYDPKVARFLSVDPMPVPASQGLNEYSYVYNNPLNLVDPTGFAGEETKDPPNPCQLKPGEDPNGCNLQRNGQQACGSVSWCTVNPNGTVSVSPGLVTVKATDEDDSNGNYFASTRDAIDFATGETPGGAHGFAPYAVVGGPAFDISEEVARINADPGVTAQPLPPVQYDLFGAPIDTTVDTSAMEAAQERIDHPHLAAMREALEAERAFHLLASLGISAFEPEVFLENPLARGLEFEADGLLVIGGEKNALAFAVPNGSGGQTVTIPDNIASDMFGDAVTEFKDVKSLSNTEQLRAQQAVANGLGVPFNIVVSPNNVKISGPLWDAVQSTGGNIYVLDPTPVEIEGE